MNDLCEFKEMFVIRADALCYSEEGRGLKKWFQNMSNVSVGTQTLTKANGPCKTIHAHSIPYTKFNVMLWHIMDYHGISVYQHILF